MGMVRTDATNYTAIADAIRSKTGGTTQYKPSEMPDGVQEVFEAGEKSEYDHFWDNFQQNGNRTDYRHAFGSCWTSATFKPKYPIVLKDAYAHQNTSSYLFAYTGQTAKTYVDLADFPLDLTKVTNVANTFENACLKNIYVDISGIAKAEKLFNGANMERNSWPYINVTIRCSETTNFLNCFWYANIQGLTFTDDSVIATSISFQWAASLTVDDVKNIIGKLKNYAGTDKELTCTLTLMSSVWAKVNEAEAPPSGATWQEHVNNLGWNIGEV